MGQCVEAKEASLLHRERNYEQENGNLCGSLSRVRINAELSFKALMPGLQNIAMAVVVFQADTWPLLSLLYFQAND